MTELKATNILKGDNELMLFDALTGETKTYESLNDMNKAVYDANLVAIKALEKRISKPVLVKDKTYYKDYFCPVCKKQQKDTRKNKREGCYCERCGQKVDWSEEE